MTQPQQDNARQASGLFADIDAMDAAIQELRLHGFSKMIVSHEHDGEDIGIHEVALVVRYDAPELGIWAASIMKANGAEDVSSSDTDLAQDPMWQSPHLGRRFSKLLAS